MVDKIRAAVSLPITNNANRKAIMDLYDSLFSSKCCRTCDSGWQSAYLMLKQYLKTIDMANKNTYQFIEGAEGAQMFINGIVLTDKTMTDEDFDKHIKGSVNESLLIVTPIATKKVKETPSDVEKEA